MHQPRHRLGETVNSICRSHQNSWKSLVDAGNSSSSQSSPNSWVLHGVLLRIFLLLTLVTHPHHPPNCGLMEFHRCVSCVWSWTPCVASEAPGQRCFEKPLCPSSSSSLTREACSDSTGSPPSESRVFTGGPQKEKSQSLLF